MYYNPVRGTDFAHEIRSVTSRRIYRGGIVQMRNSARHLSRRLSSMQGQDVQSLQLAYSDPELVANVDVKHHTSLPARRFIRSRVGLSSHPSIQPVITVPSATVKCVLCGWPLHGICVGICVPKCCCRWSAITFACKWDKTSRGMIDGELIMRKIRN